MSVMSDLDLQLQEVSEIMAEPSDTSPEVTADVACETALNALDQLMVLAADKTTAQHVMANKVFVGQILTRAQLVASFLVALETPKLKVVRNNG